MKNSWTIPSMAPPPIPVLGSGIVFQTVRTDQPFPILAFGMTMLSYQRRRLGHLVRFSF